MADYGSDDSTGDSSEWVFYKDRPEWSNVKPTPQDEGPHPVVQIAYSDKFRDVFDYFRTILRTNERSERALDLTADAASLNPANYTIWHYRRILLKDLNKDLRQELAYVGESIKDHPKTYQLWHHRSVVVEWLGDASAERPFTEKILEIDPKNYHAWQHRQWAIRIFDLWDGELDYVNRLLVEDVRNNSAWNHRYFVINNTSKFTGNVLVDEVKYTMNSIRKAVHNESAWNYLNGILFETNASKYPGIEDFVNELYDAEVRSPFLLAFMVDLYENQLELGCENKEEVLEKALCLCTSLFKEHDTIRSEYWKYLARCLAQKYTAVEDVSH